jgi:hypothetical protein
MHESRRERGFDGQANPGAKPVNNPFLVYENHMKLL